MPAKGAGLDSVKNAPPLISDVRAQMIKLSQRTLLILLPILTVISGAFIAVGNIFAPYITYNLAKDRGIELVMSQSIDASDFSISMFLYVSGIAILLAIIGVSEGLFKTSLGIIALFYILVFMCALYNGILNRGTRYPLSLRLLKRYFKRAEKYAP